MPTPEQTIAQKRATLDGMESDDREIAASYWRSGDLVVKVSMDELAGGWLRDDDDDVDEVTGGR